MNSVIVASSLFLLSACGTSANSNNQNTPNTPNNLINSNKLGTLKISSNKRMLQHEDGTGFFWMGDTAWDISKKFWNKDDKNALIDTYMEDRKSKGFSVIQTSAVSARYFFSHAAFDNNKQTININFNKPVDGYWNMIDYIVESARKNNLYVALLPVWNGVLQTADEAKEYGTFIANRYKDKKNIIWVVGGDDSKEVTNIEMWDALGKAIKSQVGNKQLISYHPPGNTSSTKSFRSASWLDFHMIQSGHCEKMATSNKLLSDTYKNSGGKPVLDAEPRYEAINECFGSNPTGYDFEAKDVREIAYRQLFSGAFGHTYGHHSVWQKYINGDKSPAGKTPTKEWKDALDDEGARHMAYVAKLMRSRPLLNRVPDQSMIQSGNAIATRGVGYAFIYLPKGGSVTANLGKISGNNVKAWWYDPRTGEATAIATYANSGTQDFNTGNEDMVLVLDDVAKEYDAPGQ